MCKLQGHVGTAIQALGFGLDRAASRPRRCAPRSGFARSSPHPRAGLLISSLAHYNFCTFVLSYFIFIVHNTTFIDNAFLFTHARSSTSDWHRHQSSQLDSFSLSIASLPFSSWQLYSSLLINRTFPPPLVAHVATLLFLCFLGTSSFKSDPIKPSKI